MRKHLLVFLGIVLSALVVSFGIRALTSRPEAATTTTTPVARDIAPLVEPLAVAPGGVETPGDKIVRQAQGLIVRAPSNPAGFNLLASAFMQKARETGDFSFNTRAEAALDKSLAVKSDDYDALKLRAKLLLTFHSFSDALAVARRAAEINPQDHDVYGAMTDALVELGRYPEAVEAAQKMVDLRPDTTSYSRVSHLRTLHGDTAGAIEAMRLATSSVSSMVDPESAAWCYVQLGDKLMTAGKLKDAEREYNRALFVFPDYHAGLAAKARARLAAGDTQEAINLYTKSQERVPTPDTVAALGDLYKSLGRDEEATRQYRLLEVIENSGTPGASNYSSQIALFWADHDMRLDDALAVARREREMRADIYTSDTLAWCLYKRGELDEARTRIEEALRLNTLDPRLHYHAGMIYNKLGDTTRARKHLKTALSLNTFLDPLKVQVAKQTLQSIKA